MFYYLPDKLSKLTIYSAKHPVSGISFLAPLHQRHFLSSGFLRRPKNLTIVIKFKYSEKATTFCKISTLLLSNVVLVKSKVEISQNFVPFSEYMNFSYYHGNTGCRVISSQGHKIGKIFA